MKNYFVRKTDDTVEADFNMKNYLVRGDVKEFRAGEKVLVKPEDHLSIRTHINLRATLESSIELKCENVHVLDSHEPLFCEENLISKEDNKYVFQTKYSKSLDDVLSLKDSWRIPLSITKQYTKVADEQLKEIAYDLKGPMENCISILGEFYKFTREKVKNKDTYGKSLKSILKELKRDKCFYGNCKEISLLYSSLCDCIGLPSKRILGKYTADEGGHMWAEVCVPHKSSHIWVPVDPAMGYFNNLSVHHIINCYIPKDARSIVEKISNKVIGNSPKISVKIEHV